MRMYVFLILVLFSIVFSGCEQSETERCKLRIKVEPEDSNQMDFWGYCNGYEITELGNNVLELKTYEIEGTVKEICIFDRNKCFIKIEENYFYEGNDE